MVLNFNKGKGKPTLKSAGKHFLETGSPKQFLAVGKNAAGKAVLNAGKKSAKKKITNLLGRLRNEP